MAQKQVNSVELPVSIEAMEAWLDRPSLDRVDDNYARLDAHVIPRHELRKHDLRRTTMVFLHFPKTGGTTAEAIISRNYNSQRQAHVNNPDLVRNPTRIFPDGRLARLIMGHHPLDGLLYRLIEQPVIHVAMLRHPVRRVISYYNYLCTSPRHSQHEVAAAMSLEEFAEAREFVEVHDGQTMRLAGALKRRYLGSPPFGPEEALARAKTTLEHRLTFLGLTERYTEFLLTGQRLLGWSEIFYVRRNVSGRATPKPEADPSTLECIAENNRLDLQLYAFAEALVDRQSAELGISERHVERFEESNRRFADLLAAPIVETIGHESVAQPQ